MRLKMTNDSPYFKNIYFLIPTLAQLEHESQVSALALCPDNSQMVSGTRDGRVVLWCLESYYIIQELPAHKRQVNGVRFRYGFT